MSTDFDRGRVYHADMIMKPSGGPGALQATTIQAKAEAAKTNFRRFLDTFTTVDGSFKYREELRKSVQMRRYFLPIELEDLIAGDEVLANTVQTHPIETIEAFEVAAADLAAAFSDVGRPASIQIEIRSRFLEPMGLRTIDASSIGKLVRVEGIVITASTPMSRPKSLTVVCKSCLISRSIPIGWASFNGSFPLPRTCPNSTACAIDPWLVIPEQSHCVDQQSLKLQELPESVPVGELPRHLLLVAERSHVGMAAPGKRMLITGIYCASSTGTSGGVALRFPWVKIVGMEPLGDQRNVGPMGPLTDAQERRLVALSKNSDILGLIARSLAPSLFGFEDIKKSIACLLFGGTHKELPDGMRLRGDINVLLLGDPGTAKSQLLKVVERIAPIAIYTSGKGSSAAGLTASVIRDHSTGEFFLEGGAMVLADGGVCCIDEFDKMRDEDRVAIHEAMEQQTISIAKAGITTILNSRTAVLAAANPVFGRYDELKAPGEAHHT